MENRELRITAKNERETAISKLLEDKICCCAPYGVKVVSTVDNFNEKYDFAVRMEGDSIVFDCPVYSFAKEAIERYFAEGECGREVTYTTDRVYYSDFGACGDGVAEDFEAMYNAHKAVNEYRRHKVCADSGAKYYIEKTGERSIEIATDVDFGDAEIIIDDRFILDTDETKSERLNWIYTFIEDYNVSYSLKNDPLEILKRINEAGGIKTTDDYIPLNLGFDALIIPVNSARYMYKRGTVQGSMGKGKPQQEIIIVRADNSVDKSTSPLFDFDSVDSIRVYRVDTKPITIRGGVFRTIATRANMQTNYVGRGMRILRSNVTIDGLTHVVDNQPKGEHLTTTEEMRKAGAGLIYNSVGGPNYSAFISPAFMTNLLVKNSKFSAKVHYNQGSYDIGGNFANSLVFDNCTQFNMFDENGKFEVLGETYWGIMGTNYCKNIEYRNSTLSRLDAHAGVYNITVKNSVVGTICAVGGGKLLVEDTELYSDTVVRHRRDYGSFWKGDIEVKNTVLHLHEKCESMFVSSGKVHNVDYGYDSVLPTSIKVDNMTYTGAVNMKHPRLARFVFDDSFFDGSPIYNNYKPVGKTTVINNSFKFEDE